MPRNQKVKVLYIAGWGRSGTTLLDNILGQLDGFFSAGELRYIWERGFLENRKCGCGQPFLECEMWQAITRSTFGEELRISPQTINQMTFRYTRTMRIFWFLATHGNNRKSIAFNEYLKTIENLYLAIARETKSQVVVDSSKYPLYGAILGLIPSLDVYTVHLIRDPRAVAYSWLTPKVTADFEKLANLPKITSSVSAMWWVGWNLAIESIGNLSPEKYLRLNYEHLVSTPRSVITTILTLLGESGSQLPFIDETTVTLGKNHTVSGNPNRFKQGHVEIIPDVRWTAYMRPLDKFLVTTLTLPFLSHFNYSILS